MDIKIGWFDWKYIPNHSMPSKRTGDNSKLISAAAGLRAALHYDQYRPRELINEAIEPDATLQRKLGYDQYRNAVDDDTTQHVHKRAIKDHGLGSDPDQIIVNCRDWANPNVFAVHLIVSVHPRIVGLLKSRGIDPMAFTDTYTTMLIGELYEFLGCGADVPFSAVLHMNQDKTGMDHPHAHVTLPGTGYDAATDQRMPLPFITPDLLSEGQNIADRMAKQELDRALTRAWRLEFPETAGTFYDPVDLPLPEPSSELDSWFPRPKIPASALAPRPEVTPLSTSLFPNGIWDAPTSFGEPHELTQLVDDLFADVTFNPSMGEPMLTSLFNPASTSVETDERGVLVPVTLPDLPAEWHKLEAPASTLPGSMAPLDGPPMANRNVPVITYEADTKPDVAAPLYQINVSEDNESFEAIVEHLWPRLMRLDSADLDIQSVDVAALTDALFPASFWESADGFGDENIARQIDELFAADDLAARSVTESDGIHFSRSTGETGLSPVEVSSGPAAEPLTELEPELDYPWRHFEAKGGHNVDYRIIPAWDADLNEGRLALALAWYEPGVQERSIVQTIIFHNTPLDYLHLDEGPADLTVAQHETKSRFEEKAAHYLALPEADFNEVMYLSFEDWVRTTALDETAKANGFVPDFPVNMLPFDPDEESGYVDPLPVGVTWLGPAETDENALRWGIITRPDSTDTVHVYAIKQWVNVNEYGASYFTASEIGLGAPTCDDQIAFMTVVEQAAQIDLGRALAGLKSMASTNVYNPNGFLAAGPPHAFADLHKPIPLVIPDADISGDDDRERSNEDDEYEFGENKIDGSDIDLDWDL